jgi:hypothetical protein
MLVAGDAASSAWYIDCSCLAHRFLSQPQCPSCHVECHMVAPFNQVQVRFRFVLHAIISLCLKCCSIACTCSTACTTQSRAVQSGAEQNRGQRIGGRAATWRYTPKRGCQLPSVYCAQAAAERLGCPHTLRPTATASASLPTRAFSSSPLFTWAQAHAHSACMDMPPTRTTLPKRLGHSIEVIGLLSCRKARLLHPCALCSQRSGLAQRSTDAHARADCAAYRPMFSPTGVMCIHRNT